MPPPYRKPTQKTYFRCKSAGVVKDEMFKKEFLVSCFGESSVGENGPFSDTGEGGAVSKRGYKQQRNSGSFSTECES